MKKKIHSLLLTCIVTTALSIFTDTTIPNNDAKHIDIKNKQMIDAIRDANNNKDTNRNLSHEDYGCSGVCPPDHKLTNPNMPIYHNDQDGTLETCRQMDNLLKKDSPYSNHCRYAQEYWSDICGCEKQMCNGICAAGSLMDENKKELKIYDYNHNDEMNTCQEVNDWIKVNMTASDVECGVIQSYLGDLCGCVTPKCTLCANGEELSDGFKDAIVIGEDPDMSCEVMASTVESLDLPSEECKLNQVTSALSCGCKKLPEKYSENVSDNCQVCGGLPIKKDHYLVPPDFKKNQPGIKCELAAQGIQSLSALSEKCFPISSMFVASGCCELTCPVCSNGGGISQESQDDYKCMDLVHESMRFEFNETNMNNPYYSYYYFNPYYDHKDSCPYLQLGGYANCGCDSGPEPLSKNKNVVKEESCALCPDGMVLSDADLETKEYEGKTCGDFEVAFEGLSKNSPYCSEVQHVSVRNNCCKEAPCQDNPFTTFRRDNNDVTCYKLSRLPMSEKNDYCYNNNAMNVCPDTCNNKCMCGDDKDLLFENPDDNTNDNNAEISCYWLTKSLSFQKRMKLCDKYPSVAKKCPETCRGWCSWYGDWSMTAPPLIEPTNSPEHNWDDWYNDDWNNNDWYNYNHTEAPSWWKYYPDRTHPPSRYTYNPYTNKPWYTTRPYTNKPWYTARPYTNKPWYTARPYTSNPWYTTSPYTSNPWYTTRPWNTQMPWMAQEEVEGQEENREEHELERE